ncbi:MAG: protein of unknown function [Leptospirillum rubarum]|nr:MAG: protein of unknown function [Leptospirillum rubarum]
MHLDNSTKKSLEAILNQKEELREAKTALKDSINKLAEEMSVKPAVVTRIIGLVEKERAKGGVLSDERDVLEAAGEIV